ncbi:MAG: cytochrome c [Nitrospira sp.]|nr:cytochrome c [Nitrospira sp.]
MMQSRREFRGNSFLKSPVWSGGILLLIVGLGLGQAWAQEQDVIAGGRHLFQKFCASCHGARAMGDGPLSGSLKPKPANLTKLSVNHGGSFPFWYAYRTIDGRDHIPGHGTRDMPVFGIWFRIPDDEVSIETEWADQVRGRIWQLLSYLESIQEREP